MSLHYNKEDESGNKKVASAAGACGVCGYYLRVWRDLYNFEYIFVEH